MPTIRQMYSGLYTLYKTTYTNGNIYRSTANSAKKVSNTFSGFNTNYNSQIQKKNIFDGNFDNAMTTLKKSAQEVKNFDFKNAESSDAVKVAEDFLNNYNGAIDFFAENNSVSSRVENLLKNFTDTKYFAKSYSEIGIEVEKDGVLKLDEEKFVSALESDSKKVSRTLETLSSRAESKISMANLQKNKLFPAFGNNSSLYGSGGFLKNYSSIGNLFNIFFWKILAI